MKDSRVYGYIRVSAKDQNEDRQIYAMRQFGVRSELIFADKQSGKDFIRPAYRRLVSRLREGDTLVVKSIDRLGRNYDDITEQWREITTRKRASIVVLDMPLLNTLHKRDLTHTLISDIVLKLLSYVAQTEREMIRQRQAEGIAAAKMRGVRLGAPKREKPSSYARIYGEWRRGGISARDAAKQLGVCHNTFLKWTRATNPE